MFHCSKGLRLQNTSSQIKLLRILILQQRSIKPSGKCTSQTAIKLTLYVRTEKCVKVFSDRFKKSRQKSGNQNCIKKREMELIQD